MNRSGNTGKSSSSLETEKTGFFNLRRKIEMDRKKYYITTAIPTHQENPISGIPMKRFWLTVSPDSKGSRAMTCSFRQEQMNMDRRSS